MRLHDGEQSCIVAENKEEEGLNNVMWNRESSQKCEGGQRM
jgi:hypothetical protein